MCSASGYSADSAADSAEISSSGSSCDGYSLPIGVVSCSSMSSEAGSCALYDSLDESREVVGTAGSSAGTVSEGSGDSGTLSLACSMGYC